MTRLFHRITIALLSGIGLASSASANPGRQAMAADAAPPSWVAYAKRVTTTVTGWLGGEEPAALQLRADLDATRAAGDQSSTPINLKLWINTMGVITRAEIDTITPHISNPDRGGMLLGREIGAAPPKGMLLPLRLSVRLDPMPTERAAQ